MAGKPGRPRSLTLDQIAQAALDDGLAAFSMPSVARRVGVAHSALYRYVADREELLLAAIDRALATIEWPSPDQEWEVLLREIGEVVWGLCDTVPGFERATLNSPRTSATWLEAFKAYVAALHDHGFTYEDAAITIDFVVRVALYGSNEMHRIRQADRSDDDSAELKAYATDEAWTGRGWYERQLQIVLTGAASLRVH